MNVICSVVIGHRGNGCGREGLSGFSVFRPGLYTIRHVCVILVVVIGRCPTIDFDKSVLCEIELIIDLIDVRVYYNFNIIGACAIVVVVGVIRVSSY